MKKDSKVRSKMEEENKEMVKMVKWNLYEFYILRCALKKYLFIH
jgi:hypothetical protein